MRRALLLFNPEAARVSPPVRDVIAHALSSELKLDVAETKRRHHATHLAQGAAHEGYDVVVVLGGDGTLNEVVNGLAGTDVPLIPLPGGGTNVFARTHGLPKDAIAATSIVLEHLREGRQPRRINLGRINGRAFAFCAGVAFDAAVVRAVERRFRMKRKIGEGFFVAQALRVFLLAPRKRPLLTLHAAGKVYDGLHEAIVCNSDPFTYLGRRPFRLCPLADPEKGLDVTALTSVRTGTVLRIAVRAFTRADHIRMRQVRALHDLAAFRIDARLPVAWQVDGDYAGEDTTFEFQTEERALSVLA